VSAGAPSSFDPCARAVRAFARAALSEGFSARARRDDELP